MMDGIGGDLFVLYWDAENRRAHRLERLRTRALRASLPLSWRVRGVTAHAARGNPRRHRSRSRRWLGPTSPALSEICHGTACSHRPSRMPSKASRSPKPSKNSGPRRYRSNACQPRRIVASILAATEIRRGRRSFSAIPTWPALTAALAAAGSRAFYEGEIAAAILKTSQSLGGTMTAEDLSSLLGGMGRTHFDRLSRLARL